MKASGPVKHIPHEEISLHWESVPRPPLAGMAAPGDKVGGGLHFIPLSDLAELAGDLVVAGDVADAWIPAGPFVVDLDGVDIDLAVQVAKRLAGRTTPLIIGRSTHRVPDGLAPLLSRFTVTLAPDGPGRSWVSADDDALVAIQDTVASAPVAAAVLTGILAQHDSGPVSEALTLESAAYSMLLGSEEFLRWRARTPLHRAPEVASQVRVERERNVLRIELDRPNRHNAFSHVMRNQLLEALEVAEADPTVTRVVLSGAGSTFCSGGDLAEFGSAGSPALSHLLRLQSSAGFAVHRLRERVRPVLHGA